MKVISPIRRIMGTKQAAAMWGLSESYVKDLCRLGVVEAVQIGKTWIIAKNHPNPKFRLSESK